jgi:uncharacterized membrane protein
MNLLIVAAAAFLLTHYIASTPLRGALINVLGEKAYRGVYVLLAFATLGWMIWAFNRAPLVPLWQVPGLRHLPSLLMPFAFIFAAAGVMTKNPSAVAMEGALKAKEPAQGILRVTRHPLMWGIALWGLVHLLAKGDASSLVFFGGFVVLALSGTVLIDRRKRATLGEDWARFAAVTSNVPFAAIAGGRNQFRLAEIGWTKIGVGLALFVVFLLAHPYLFGVRPY